MKTNLFGSNPTAPGHMPHPFREFSENLGALSISPVNHAHICGQRDYLKYCARASQRHTSASWAQSELVRVNLCNEIGEIKLSFVLFANNLHAVVLQRIDHFANHLWVHFSIQQHLSQRGLHAVSKERMNHICLVFSDLFLCRSRHRGNCYLGQDLAISR